MALRTFRGGIHPPGFKELTKDSPIRAAALPAKVRIPLKQNAGKPPRLLVKENQRVRTGDKIAGPSAPISASLHASISGTVRKIGSMPVPYGGDALCVEIEGDGRDEKSWGSEQAGAPLALSGADILTRIKDAGVVGLGGAEFPTHCKLSPPPEKDIDCLIINGAECEPYLTVDHRLMLEQTDKIISGVKLMMKAAGVNRAYIGIERNKTDAFDRISERLGKGLGIEPVLLKVKYPQGAEKQLIYSILRREVPPGGLPSDAGVIVQNVGTAAAVFDACALDKPLFERVVTVSGPGINKPGNWLARIGTPFSELIEQSGGFTDDAKILVMGGGMMGVSQWTAAVPVVKGTSGILALRESDLDWAGDRPCIRCGKCIAVCPMGLSPALIKAAVEKERWEEAEKYGVMDCIECGACAYVCSSSRNQLQLFQRAKSELRKLKKRNG
jgi:electron transport complex protein RnfC